MSPILRLTASIGVMTLCALPPASAQQVPLGRVVSFGSPLLWMFGSAGLGYEQRVTRAVSFGGSASHRRVSHVGYTSATLDIRYYPRRVALTGFSVGASGGVHRALRRQAPGLGMGLGYAWRAGPRRNIVLTIGFGETLMLRPVGGLLSNFRAFDMGIAF